jgi:three-Cys-motif partner protein
MASTAADTNPEYWAEYTNLQQVKHDLIRSYLGGWFAKLGFWAGRVVYLDTHAGRGAYATGHLGSPLVALDTLLSHRALGALLKKSEFRFLFIERDPENLEQLKKELASRKLPKGVYVDPHCADAFDVLDDIVKRTKGLAPAFVFVDPYGFKVPGATLRAVLKAGRVELFVNVIWRELDMAIRMAQTGEKPGMAATLNEIFDGEEWKTAINADDIDERADQAVRLLAQKIGARWHTYIRMLGDNGRTRYVLLHLTNHDEGRDLMKDCVWKVAPDGGYYARKSVDPGQLLLITPTPDLTPFRDWVLERLKAQPRRWRDLQAELRPELWREPQLNEIVRALRAEGTIEGTDYEGLFSAKANPLLRLRSSTSAHS